MYLDITQRAELGIDGNCGYALIGVNIQEGEAEFVEIPQYDKNKNIESSFVTPKGGMMKPIDRLITSRVHCTRCGAQGVGTCDCWVQCACGWTKGRGEECGNPNCSQHTKVGAGRTAWDVKKHGTGPLSGDY